MELRDRLCRVDPAGVAPIDRRPARRADDLATEEELFFGGVPGSRVEHELAPPSAVGELLCALERRADRHSVVRRDRPDGEADRDLEPALVGLVEQIERRVDHIDALAHVERGRQGCADLSEHLAAGGLATARDGSAPLADLGVRMDPRRAACGKPSVPQDQLVGQRRRSTISLRAGA